MNAPDRVVGAPMTDVDAAYLLATLAPAEAVERFIAVGNQEYALLALFRRVRDLERRVAMAGGREDLIRNILKEHSLRLGRAEL